jgi:hypothetical protein
MHSTPAARLGTAARLAGAFEPTRRPKETQMRRMVAAIFASTLVAASFVEIASAGWSW